MSRQLNIKRLAAVGMLICIPGLVSCSADEPKPNSAAAKAAAPAEASPADLSIADPAFERYVDLVMLGRAWDALDASLITDCALQLAEGERVLKRNHKAIKSNQVLALAVKVAADKNDTAALDRLAKIGETTKNTAITEQVAAAKKLGGKSRKVTDPAFSISVDDTTPTQLALYQEVISQAKAADIAGDKTFFKNFQGSFDDKASLLTTLTESQRKHLRQIMGESMKRLPQESDETFHNTLAKLRSASRSTPFVPQFQSEPPQTFNFTPQQVFGSSPGDPGSDVGPFPVRGPQGMPSQNGPPSGQGFGGGMGTSVVFGRPVGGFGNPGNGGGPYGQGGWTPFGQGGGPGSGGNQGVNSTGHQSPYYPVTPPWEDNSGLRGCWMRPKVDYERQQWNWSW